MTRCRVRIIGSGRHEDYNVTVGPYFKTTFALHLGTHRLQTLRGHERGFANCFHGNYSINRYIVGHTGGTIGLSAILGYNRTAHQLATRIAIDEHGFGHKRTAWTKNSDQS